MMQTDDLITHLSAGLAPVRTGTATRILVTGIALGVMGAVALMLVTLGLRPDLGASMSSFGMGMKLAYTFALAALGFGLVARAGRPGANMMAAAWWLALPLLAIAVIAALQMMAPGVDRHALMMGHSARVCAVLVAMVALPILAGTFVALRQLAPTRLTLAGAGAGLFAGAAGAFVYSFHCTESTAPFVAIWYTLGIALSAIIGAVSGRWFLRW